MSRWLLALRERRGWQKAAVAQNPKIPSRRRRERRCTTGQTGSR
jgi:hypothetical protein